MTEEQSGVTAPEPAANTAIAEQASEDTVAAVAVADEPATETGDAAPASGSENGVAADDGSGESVPEALTAAEADAGEADGAATDSATEPQDVATEPQDGATAAQDVAAEARADAEPADDTNGTAASGSATTEAATASETAPEPATAEAPTNGQAPADALSAAETADAPAASDDEEEEPTPARVLGPEPTTMEELLAEQDTDIKSFKHGDVVEGQVVRIDKDEILVDIGAKSEGVVSNRELFGRHGEGQPALNIGDTVLVYVLQPESPEGHVVLSLRRAGLERKWRSMQEQFETGVIIEAPVIDHNKGGLIVDCGIRGFVPISQIVDFPRRPQNDQPRDAAQEIAEKLMPFVGRKLRLKILEVNRKANRLILSEKVALYEERREKRDELFSSLQVGQKVTGTVRSIAPFGVFIDLGGIDGLVHKSELSWNKVNNPEAGYQVGEQVEAEVIDINHERGRISLSIRRLQPDPWHSTVADFKVGDVIDGTVTKLVNFGAFVRVRDGLEGLIHISELSHQRVAHPGDVVHEGQSLKLKIISLDSERHRLGLSLKQAEEPPARPAVEASAPGVAAAPGAPRPERRPRPERSYSLSDAVQEPEGGIDNTLASAFAQVRQQLAEAEVDGVAAPAAEDAATEDAPAADAVDGAATSDVADTAGPVVEDRAVEDEAPAETSEATVAAAEIAAETAEPVEATATAEAIVADDEVAPEAPAPTEVDASGEVTAETDATEATEPAPSSEATADPEPVEAIDATAPTEPAETPAPDEAVETETAVDATADDGTGDTVTAPEATEEPAEAPPAEAPTASGPKSKKAGTEG